MKRYLFVLFVSAVAILFSQTKETNELALEQSVESDLVTPHTSWAKPYAQGRIRALFFIRGHGTEPREVIELKQRFDIEPQMVFWARIVDTTNEGWHGAEAGIRRIEVLLERKWDVFVFFNIPPERLSVDLQYAVFKQVTDGAGLVLYGIDDKRVLKDKNVVDPLPRELSLCDFKNDSAAEYASMPAGTPYRVKSGRGIRISMRPGIAYRPGWNIDYDYWAAHFGRAMLWAAGKEPKSSLSLALAAAALDRRSMGALTIRVTNDGKSIRTIDLRIRRSDGFTLPLPAQSVTGAIMNLSVPLPPLSVGSYRVDAVARGPRGIENFADIPFSVTGARAVTNISLTEDWAEIGGTISGTVAVTGAPSGGERIVVSMLDPRGRELVRKDIPAADGAAFSFPVDDGLPMLVTVRASLMEKGTEASYAWKFAHVVKRNRGRFNFLMWDIPSGTLGPYGEESLARNGVSLQLSMAAPPDYAAANNIAWVPYTTRIKVQRERSGVMKPVCWNDDEKIQEYVDGIVQKSVPARQHGVFVYSLGDEVDVRGSCLSPHCLAAYQEYLKGLYGDIGALNASWGTSFTDFRNVSLSKPDDNDEQTAFRAGNFPRWYDRQTFQSHNFCMLCERFGKAFRGIDPESRCGFEGAGTLKAADDLDGFVRHNTFWSPYPGTADEVVRSIAPRDFPRANWMGYTRDADSLLEKYWRMVTLGMDAVWWWRWDGIGRFHGWLSLTLDPYPATREILADTRIVREGLGDLLTRCEMMDDGIGILFSLPSAYAAKTGTSPSFGDYDGDHAAWHGAIRDLGLSFRYFTDRQLVRGEIDLKKFKMIVLPFTQALSAGEAAKLREYVQSGGVLVADVRPALFDEHLRPLSAGMLDDLFGVQRISRDAAATTSASFTGKLAGISMSADVPGLRVDIGIRTAGAQAYGTAKEGAPLLVVNGAGSGKAILLNCALASYPKLSADSTPESNADVLKAIIRSASLSPAVELRNAKGERLRNVECTRWKNGDEELISVFRHMGAAENATISFPAATLVWDLKKGERPPAAVKTYGLPITPYRAQFFSLNRAAPAPVSVNVVSPNVAAGTRAIVKLSSAQRTSIHLSVKAPDGTVADWMNTVIVVDRSGATAEIPIAYNDPKGTWSVAATDLYGRTKTITFTVK